MHRLETNRDRPLIYFFKLARFSNTNAYVEAQLRRHFPEAEVATIDLKPLFTRPSAALARAVAAALISLAGERLAGRRRQRTRSSAVLEKLLRSAVMFEFLSRAARRMVERERRRVWFTIQTQSLWNSAVPGIPNFVYTDCTLLANLYFKDAQFGGIPSARWLDLEREIYRSAARTFVMSGHVARSLTELYGIDADKVACVYAGANLQALPQAPMPAPQDNKTILFVGVEWERKGGPELLEAFQRLPDRHRDARLVIVGVAPALNAARCEIVGRVPADKVADYYARAAIFCLPTRIESFGIAFIEAMMHSVAVAAPHQGAMPDYIKEGQTGMLFAPGDRQDIARALTWLLDHPAERRAMAARGFEAVRSVYTWDAVGQRLRTHILAAAGPAPAGENACAPRSGQPGTLDRRRRSYPKRELSG
jgi:glycosyltransferase involved in cell wall biosynthesis